MLATVKTQIRRRGFLLILAALAALVLALVGWAALDKGDRNDAVVAADEDPSLDGATTDDPADRVERTPTATEPTTDETSPEETTAPSDDPSSRPTLSTTEQSEIPRESLAPGGGAQAATDLSARSECNPSTGVSAVLTWAIAAQRGEVQRVAITQYADGMETQRFSLSPELSAGAREYFWTDGLEPGILYRWEVLTRHGDLYTRSVTETFQGADCFADS